MSKQGRRSPGEVSRGQFARHVHDRIRYRDLFVLDPDVTIDTISSHAIRHAARASLEAGAQAPRWLLYAAEFALALMALWLIRGKSDLVLLAMAWVTLAAAVFLLVRTARATAFDE